VRVGQDADLGFHSGIYSEVQRFFAALRMREQTFARGDRKHFVGMIGQVLRSTDMTRQSAYQLLWGRILRMGAIRKQGSSEQPARTLPAEIQPQR